MSDVQETFNEVLIPSVLFERGVIANMEDVEFKVYVSLLAICDSDGYVVRSSQQIAIFVGFSSVGVRYALHCLEDRGLIEVDGSIPPPIESEPDVTLQLRVLTVAVHQR